MKIAEQIYFVCIDFMCVVKLVKRGNNIIMKFQIYWIKLKARIETVLSKLVYNFRKRIKGVKTVWNKRYK